MHKQGTLREIASMSAMVKGTLASFAMARMWSTVLVEPPIATSSAIALQNALWAQMTQRVTESPTDPVSELMGSMNAAFDSSTAMRLAMEYRMPEQVVWLLLGIGLVTLVSGLAHGTGHG